MRSLLIILIFTSVACSTRQIEDDKIEEREDGLMYYKGTDSLVTGTVIRKFESDQIAAKSKYKKGKQIGDWFSYGYAGEDISHGYSLELDKSIISNYKNLNLNSSTISFTTEYKYKYAELSIPENSPSPSQLDFIMLNNDILTTYQDKHTFQDIIIEYKQIEYRFKKNTYTIKSARFDSVESNGRVIVNVQ